MENIQIEITVDDIEQAGVLAQEMLLQKLNWPIAGPSPASVALERTTGSKWKTLGAVVLMEEQKPFRFGSVPIEMVNRLERFLATGKMQPCPLALELHTLKSRTGSAFEE